MEGSTMATYVVLAKFTDQGIRNVKQTTDRAETARAMAQKVGCTMREIYWTLGEYDVVTIIDAPDEKALTAFGLSLGAAGNVKSQTLRAFNKDEMTQILAKMG
jgi:uncharacterized protein with GYD domain